MANENATKENIMGREGITPLLFRISLPLMISMLVQALYNIVDSMFVARLSETALTAVSLAFPLQNLLIAFGVAESTASEIAGIIMSGATCIAYIMGEGIVDAEHTDQSSVDTNNNEK